MCVGVVDDCLQRVGGKFRSNSTLQNISRASETLEHVAKITRTELIEKNKDKKVQQH